MRAGTPRRLYYCDHHELPLPAGHKFPVQKYALLRQMLAADGCYQFEQAPFADPAIIRLVHDADYVQRFLDGTLTPSAMRRIGFPWSEGLVRRTLASVGGTLRAVADAMATGFGGNLAGGTHHAFRAEGAGFCVFNDIAVAIESLRPAGRVRRAAILDLDVHQGDGTAAIFEDDPDVLTVSLHGRNNFPFRKQRSKIDVALADGTGDEEYFKALTTVLPQVFAFRPEILLYQSGVDALATDVLGRLALSPAGLRVRDREVMAAARAYGVPFVVTLGGGYSNPIELTAEAHANTYRTAAEVFGRDPQGWGV
ncbi:MAG TPA: histone deacetylase [Bryobacteraceae bacterium]|nr:histone deacetylase [Bryobacteraceae bacterium]